MRAGYQLAWIAGGALFAGCVLPTLTASSTTSASSSASASASASSGSVDGGGGGKAPIHEPTPKWLRSLESNTLTPTSVAIAPNGDVLFVATQEGTFDFGDASCKGETTSTSVLVARFAAAQGACLWAVTFGAASDAKLLVLDDDSLAVAGNYVNLLTFTGCMAIASPIQDVGSAFFAKLDRTGACTALVQASGDAFAVHDLARGPASSYLVAGGDGDSTLQPQALSLRAGDYAVDTSLLYTSSSDAEAFGAVAIDATSAAIAGTMRAAVVSPDKMSVDPKANRDVFVARTSVGKAPTTSWMTALGIGQSMTLGGLSRAANAGGLVVGGGADTNGFLVGLTDDGHSAWKVNLTAMNGGAKVNAVASQPDGQAVAVGTFNGDLLLEDGHALSAPSSKDGFLIGLDGDGKSRFLLAITGGNANQTADVVATSAAGDVVVAGTSDGAVQLGGLASPSSSSQAYLVRLTAP